MISSPDNGPKSREQNQSDLPDLRGDSLGYTLRRAQLRCYAVMDEMFGAELLSPTRMTALSIIGGTEGCSQASLGRELGINRASTVKLIDSLEDLGFVRRGQVAGNRRTNILALTEKGLAELWAWDARLTLYEARIAAEITPEERNLLIGLLGRIARLPIHEGEDQPGASGRA